MSASPSHYQRRIARRVTVLSPFLRHLNTGTLAFVMFVAFALLSSIRGKESETRGPASAKATASRVILDKLVHSPQKPTLPPGVRATSNEPDKPGDFQTRH